MDETEVRLVRLLSENGRRNNKDLAALLGVSEGTVRNRVKKLTDEKRLRVAGLINPEDIRGRQIIFLGIKIAISKDLCEIAEKISRLERVNAVYITSGRYDIMTEIWVDADGGLIRFISDSLNQINGIISTESFLVMKNYNKWIPLAKLS